MAEKRRRTAEGQAAAEEGWLASLDRVEQIQEELEDINDEVASRVLQLEREVHQPQPRPQPLPQPQPSPAPGATYHGDTAARRRHRMVPRGL